MKDRLPPEPAPFAFALGRGYRRQAQKQQTLPNGRSGQEEDEMGHSEFDPATRERRPWNAGRMVGAKRALKPQQVWAIRFWLDRERRLRDRALFDLAIDALVRRSECVP